MDKLPQLMSALLPDSDLAILGTAGVFLGVLLAFEGIR